MGELTPSLLTALWRKELLVLAGDVESNPGPYTKYTLTSKDLGIVLMYIPISSYLLTSKCNYHKITSCGMYGTTSSKSTNYCATVNLCNAYQSLKLL